MATAERKARKRARFTALDRGDTALAESLRFRHPRKTATHKHPSQRPRVFFDGTPIGRFLSWLRR